MPLDPEALYHHVGRLIESMPTNLRASPLPSEAHQWLGQAHALVMEGGDILDKVDWRAAVGKLGSNVFQAQGEEEIRQILYRILASAELKAPARVKGTFIPVGGSFDAYAAVSKILQSATQDVFIVDPYMDESALTEFGLAVPDGVPIRLMADGKDYKPSLVPAAQKWSMQYGAARPLAVRLAPAGALHDRAVFVDRKTAWALTQSLKDFAKRSPGEIIRAEDTAALKIAAYEDTWQKAAVVV